MSEASEGSFVREVDVQGTFCPRPVIETARAIKEIARGEILRVVGTDRGMHSDFPAWCKATGHELVDMHEEGDRIFVSIRRRR
ncbi:MAG: sulfurtransferase TusA family protein [Deltaproteobacteria bacterium]|nr:sulfurtransferase TusA family protein [Deltaproteobacteria bacterium]